MNLSCAVMDEEFQVNLWSSSGKKFPAEPIHHVMSVTVIANIVCPLKGGKQEDE